MLAIWYLPAFFHPIDSIYHYHPVLGRGFTPGNLSIPGKRLVILACELDSGKERRFTPETDPELPVRVAVRMSMGVPGLMEPFKYGGAGNGELLRMMMIFSEGSCNLPVFEF